MRIYDLLELNSVLYPTHSAVEIVDGPQVTYQELKNRVSRIAAGLRDMGIESGSRVVLVAENGLSYFDIFLSTAHIGAAAVPINTHLVYSEMEYIVKNSDPALIFADEVFVQQLKSMEVAPVVSLDGPEYEKLTEIETSLTCESSEEDIALIIYTSGTTGRPKGACLTQRGLTFNAVTTAEVQEFQHEDVFLSSTPLYHAAAGTRVVSMLADGQTHVVLSKFDPDSWLSTVERYRVTIAVLVPTQMRQILEHENLNNYDLSSLRLLVYGAAPSPGPLVEKAYKELNCGLYQGYGISECVTSLTALLPQDHVLAMTKRPELLGSCGRPVPGVYIEIRNKNGGLVKCGEVGEIWVLTEKVMAGYWNDEIQTAKVLKDGWFRTGDLAHQDEEGYLFIVGRKTDMLISGGVNIYPSEIEEVLCHHPKIKEVAVVGVSDSNWGERPVAYVKTDGDCEMLELRKFCEKSLSTIKVPDYFFFVSEFPRTATGKIRKVDLRKMAEESTK